MDYRLVTVGGGRFLVGRDGTVRTPLEVRLYSHLGRKKIWVSEERQISPTLLRSGYLEIASVQSGKRVRVLLHRLIAMAWVPGYKHGLCVNHIDGNKLNNSISNLEWVTLARNTEHSWQTGLCNARGEKHPSSKLKDSDAAECVRRRLSGESAKKLADEYGVSTALVYKMANGTKRPFLRASGAVRRPC